MRKRLKRTFKKAPKGILLGLALLLVASQFAFVGVLANDETPEPYPTIRVEPPLGGFRDIGNVINNLAKIIFIFAIVLVFLYFMYGGIRWITSGGDKAQTEAARNVLTAALIGFAVIALAFAIVRLIGTFFGIDIFGGFEIPTPPPEATPTPTP